MATEAKIVLKATDETKGAFASVSRNFDQMKTGAAGAIAALGAIGLGAGTAAAAFERFNSITNLLDQLDKLSEKTGVSVEGLSALRYAGDLAGVPIEGLGAGLGRLSRTMAEAAGGNKEAAATFAALGVDVVGANGKLRSAEDVLRDVATRFAGYEDGAAKAALAQRLFGKSGADLIPLLNSGGAGLERMADEAKRLGAVYDKDVSRAAVELNDNLTKLRLASEGTAVTIAGPLIKALADLSAKFVQAKIDGNQLSVFLEGASWLSPAGALINLTKIYAGVGQAAAKTTEQIQAYVNAIGGPNAGAGRGFVNPQVAAPVVNDATPPKASTKDPLAEAKRYLETLQKQFETLQDLTTVQQTLRDLEMGRLGQVTPALEKEILATARLIDLKKAETKEAELQKQVREFEARQLQRNADQAERLRRSVETPFEELQTRLKDISRIAEENPLISDETISRLNGKAWKEYLETLDSVRERHSQLTDYIAETSDVVEQTEGAVVNAFRGMEDALVNFVRTGKLDFKSLADSIIADITRIIVKQQITGPLASAIQGKGGGGFLASLFPGLFGFQPVPGTTINSFGGAASSGFGTGAGYGNLDFGGFFASGIDYVPKDMLAVIHKGEAVIPAAENAGGGRRGSPINLVQNFAPGTTKATIDQAAQAAGIALQRALARNG